MIVQKLTLYQHPNLGPRGGATKTRSRGYPRRPRHRQEGVDDTFSKSSEAQNMGRKSYSNTTDIVYMLVGTRMRPFSFVSLDLDGLDAR